MGNGLRWISYIHITPAPTCPMASRTAGTKQLFVKGTEMRPSEVKTRVNFRPWNSRYLQLHWRLHWSPLVEPPLEPPLEVPPQLCLLVYKSPLTIVIHHKYP